MILSLLIEVVEIRRTTKIEEGVTTLSERGDHVKGGSIKFFQKKT